MSVVSGGNRLFLKSCHSVTDFHRCYRFRFVLVTHSCGDEQRLFLFTKAKLWVEHRLTDLITPREGCLNGFPWFVGDSGDRDRSEWTRDASFACKITRL
jgi:hypothetical protein